MSHRARVVPRSGSAWSGSRFPTKFRNGGLRRTKGFAAARSRPAPAAITAGEELKFFDTALADGTLSATLSNNNLNIIPQGILNNNRIGRKCVVQAVHVRGSYTLLAATDATNTSNRVRQRIVLDTQTNLSDFAAGVFLESDVIDSFSKLANKGRFRVLSDEVYVLTAAGAAPSGAALIFGEDIVDVNVNLRCKIPIEFSDVSADGAVTSQTSNSLHLVTQTSTSETVASSLQVRIRFLD